MKRLWLWLILMNPLNAFAETIFLASPPMDDYYESAERDIVQFHINFAKKIIENGDDVSIFIHPAYYGLYTSELDERHLIKGSMGDIWMRDFTTVNPNQPLLFDYTAEGQGGDISDSKWVQDVFLKWFDSQNLPYQKIDMLNDGGNFVEDGYGNVVISTKFLKDNHMDEESARDVLIKLPGVNHIAFIEAEEQASLGQARLGQGGLEHADGVVSFIDENTLIINNYPEDPEYMDNLIKDLKRGLPNVKIHPIITPYDASTIYDERFGSACGLYTNALVTPTTVYLPQFNIPEDKIALDLVRSLTDKKVIGIDSSRICHMGGGVRCMSWQLRGSP